MRRQRHNNGMAPIRALHATSRAAAAEVGDARRLHLPARGMSAMSFDRDGDTDAKRWQRRGVSDFFHSVLTPGRQVLFSIPGKLWRFETEFRVNRSVMFNAVEEDRYIWEKSAAWMPRSNRWPTPTLMTHSVRHTRRKAKNGLRAFTVDAWHTNRATIFNCRAALALLPAFRSADGNRLFGKPSRFTCGWLDTWGTVASDEAAAFLRAASHNASRAGQRVPVAVSYIIGREPLWIGPILQALQDESASRKRAAWLCEIVRQSKIATATCEGVLEHHSFNIDSSVMYGTAMLVVSPL